MTPATRDVVPSLDGDLKTGEVSVSLTEAGLLPDRTAAMVQLYAEHHSWAEVKVRWHEDRIHGRGSRGSAQKIFRILKRRLQSGGTLLPSISDLHPLVEACPTTKARAQLFYFYLIEEDGLFRWTLHEILRRQGIDRTEWNLSTDLIASLLSQFHYTDQSKLTYADSTLKRWAQGFRSVLRDIGVIDGPYDSEGTVPALDEAPLHIGALYSWNVGGKDWPQRPVGWYYLFQPTARREALLNRLQSSGRWRATRLRNQTVLKPSNQDGAP
jgi:hypothetical protein